MPRERIKGNAAKQQVKKVCHIFSKLFAGGQDT